jgi:CubicO group peptidase (beta-lactamase class C family)
LNLNCIPPGKYMRNPLLKLLLGGLLLVLLACCRGADAVQVTSPQLQQLPHASSTQQGLTSAQELEDFFDRFFAEQMQVQHIPGLVIALVKDGKLFFSKGYGYANLEQQRPVIPDQTVFRVGSISKLFTATAVMQLVEQGKLGLEDDVNQHLKRFQLDSTYAQPVTIANLLTHTGGIDEQFIGIAARSANQILSPGDYLTKHLPSRMLRPNSVIRYSNQGFVLAGYLAELASGLPFAQLIEQKILQPLGMHHSSFLLRSDVLENLATGYHYRNGNDKSGSYQPLPIVYSNDVPSASLNVTAADMANFIIAHLQEGRYGNVELLQKDTAEVMHQQHFTNHPGIAGQAYGFYEWLQNGQRGLMHAGEIVGFKSSLFLLPDHRIGWFIAHNNEKGTLQDELIHQFLNHYYPSYSPTVNATPFHTASQKPLPAQTKLRSLSGRYRYIRYPRRTIDKVAAIIPGSPLFAKEFQVSVDDNTLNIESSRFVEVEPLLFQQIAGDSLMFRGLTFDTVGFRKSDSGQIADLSLGKYAFEKLLWYERTALHLGVLIVCQLVFWVTGLVWLVKAIRGSLKSRSIGQASLLQWIQPLAASICFLNLGFPIGLALALSRMNLYELAYGAPPSILALLCIPLISTFLTLMLSILMLLTWQERQWPNLGRWHSLSIVFAAGGFIWLLNDWNLLGFRF